MYSPDASFGPGELLFVGFRIMVKVLEDEVFQFRRIGSLWGGYRPSADGDDGGDFGPLEALADDLGGEEAGGATDDELHDAMVWVARAAGLRYIEWQNQSQNSGKLGLEEGDSVLGLSLTEVRLSDVLIL